MSSEDQALSDHVMIASLGLSASPSATMQASAHEVEKFVLSPSYATGLEVALKLAFRLATTSL